MLSYAVKPIPDKPCICVYSCQNVQTVHLCLQLSKRSLQTRHDDGRMHWLHHRWLIYTSIRNVHNMYMLCGSMSNSFQVFKCLHLFAFFWL